MRPSPHRRAVPPPAAGVGLRTVHYRDLLETQPPVGFLEVHSENFFGVGGQPMAVLERARSLYPLSLHGVGLSLGGAEPLDRRHLRQLSELTARIDPWLVSDHLAWSGIGGRYSNDLLPLPLTNEALRVMADHVNQVQDTLGRAILVENPSVYVAFADSQMPEPEFLARLADIAGCGLLLDVNNVFVSARNLGFDPGQYLATIPATAVGEIHLAGHVEAGALLIDTHSRPVAPAVWRLYADAVRRFGAVPTLIEWDADLPALATLVGEAARADAIRASALNRETADARAA